MYWRDWCNTCIASAMNGANVKLECVKYLPGWKKQTKKKTTSVPYLFQNQNLLIYFSKKTKTNLNFSAPLQGELTDLINFDGLHRGAAVSIVASEILEGPWFRSQLEPLCVGMFSLFLSGYSSFLSRSKTIHEYAWMFASAALWFSSGVINYKHIHDKLPQEIHIFN